MSCVACVCKQRSRASSPQRNDLRSCPPPRDSKRNAQDSFHAKELPIPARGPPQGGRWLRRVDDGFGNLPLVLNGEPDDLGLLEGAASGFIGRAYDKVGDGAPLDFRGAFQALQNVDGHPHVKARRGLRLFGHITTIRQPAVQRQGRNGRPPSGSSRRSLVCRDRQLSYRPDTQKLAQASARRQ